MNKENTKKTKNKPRVNNEIVGYETVRLLYKDRKDVSKNFNRIMSWHEAVELSNEYSLDLIEINDKTEPPIIYLEDFSKYMYNIKKQDKLKKHNKVIIKEIQLSANISEHDIEIKAKKALSFIAENKKVKVVLYLKGRELAHKQENKKTFYRFLEIMLNSGNVTFDNPPKDEERKCITILKKK